MQDFAIPAEVGRRVRALRESQSETQQTLATRAGIATRTLASLEAGQDVSLDTLRKLATALGVTVAELVGGSAPDKQEGAA